MADTTGISRWIVKIEDDPRHPGISKDLGDGAGLTRYGITQKWHSKDVPANFFTTMSNEDAANAAASVYERQYCVPCFAAAIASDDVASALVSFAVNKNVRIAVGTLQGALGVTQDGSMGPQTLTAINRQEPIEVAAAFRAAWTQFYRNDVAANPSKEKFLNGWINERVNRIYPN